MWKMTFFFGMMLSLEVNANTCNIQDIEGIVELLKQSPQEKHYRDTTNRLLELKLEEDTRGSRPEFSAGINLDKDNSSNKELTAELLFSIDDYRNLNTKKQLGNSERELKTTEFQKEYNSRLADSAIALFKISQNQFLLEKIEGLLATINSSEAIYKNRPIRSRDEEIILSSLGMLKNNLILKKSRLQDLVYENKLQVKKWDELTCSIDYKTYSSIIKDLKINFKNTKESLAIKELKHKTEMLQYSTQLEARRLFGNLKVGPSISKEKVDDKNEYRFGVAVSFDLATFGNSNSSYIEESKKLSFLEKDRSIKIAEIDEAVIEERFKKHLESLRQLPSVEKLESDIKTIKKSFDSGVVSPLVYLESYRSYVEFLEVSEDVRLNVLENYFKLRGQYAENSH